MELKTLFDSWAEKVDGDYAEKQWMLSKWEVVEGIQWPQEKVAQMVQSIMEGLQLKTTDTLFDLGCGGGWILKALAPYIKKGVGVDFSLPMLSNARVLSPSETFVCGEIGKLPLRDNSCECILCFLPNSITICTDI